MADPAVPVPPQPVAPPPSAEEIRAFINREFQAQRHQLEQQNAHLRQQVQGLQTQIAELTLNGMPQPAVNPAHVEPPPIMPAPQATAGRPQLKLPRIKH